MSRSWTVFVVALVLASAAGSPFDGSDREGGPEDGCDCGQTDDCPPLCADDGCACCAALAPFATVNTSSDLGATVTRVRFDETRDPAPELPDPDGLARVPIAPRSA